MPQKGSAEYSVPETVKAEKGSVEAQCSRVAKEAVMNKAPEGLCRVKWPREAVQSTVPQRGSAETQCPRKAK